LANAEEQSGWYCTRLSTSSIKKASYNQVLNCRLLGKIGETASNGAVEELQIAPVFSPQKQARRGPLRLFVCLFVCLSVGWLGWFRVRIRSPVRVHTVPLIFFQDMEADLGLDANQCVLRLFARHGVELQEIFYELVTD
jgi:hypothetical protein